MRIVKAQDEHNGDQSSLQPPQDAVPILPFTDMNPAGDINAFLGKGVHFKGTITYQGTIRIDGTLDGEVHTDGVVLVGEEAEINADVTAGTIVCKGKINGNICAKEKLIVQAPSIITGGVQTPTLSIEEGALLDGTLEMSQGAHDIKRKPSLRDMRSSEHFMVRRMAV